MNSRSKTTAPASAQPQKHSRDARYAAWLQQADALAEDLRGVEPPIDSFGDDFPVLAAPVQDESLKAEKAQPPAVVPPPAPAAVQAPVAAAAPEPIQDTPESRKFRKKIQRVASKLGLTPEEVESQVRAYLGRQK